MPPTEAPPFARGDRYRRLGPYLRQRFGRAVHKVSLRAGFGCPNRDGRLGDAGCLFCSPRALVPRGQAARGSIERQLGAGLANVQRRYGPCAAVAYFQEGSATDAPVERLRGLYTAALDHPEVVALSVGTRPDCLPDDALDLLAELAVRKPVWLELGLQTANDRILQELNRGHDVATFASAVRRARARGLEVVAHVILDLPGETEPDRIATAACLNSLGIQGVKVHNLHVLADTPLAQIHRAGRLRLASLADYADMAAGFLQRLRSEPVIHRLSGEGPADLMVAPDWGRQKQRIREAIEAALAARGGWQGQHPA